MPGQRNANLRPPSWLALLALVPACSLTFSYPDEESETSSALCADDTDNDYDGFTDCDDPDCDGHCPEQSAGRCSDGRDNDGDGLTDDLDPRCWTEVERDVVRCASTDPIAFEERFDGMLSTARWLTFGEVAGKPLSETQRPLDRDARLDNVLGSPSVAIPMLGGLVSARVFDGDWSSFDLSFSARLDQGGYLRVGLVPAALAPDGEPPTEGAELASVLVTLDARAEPSVVLGAKRDEATTAWTLPGWQQIRLTAVDEQLVVRVGEQDILSLPLPALVPSRIGIWTEARSSEDGLSAAQLDDLRLTFPGYRPCKVASPQIPLGRTCRQDPSKLEHDVGFTVAMASSDGVFCALLTSAPTGAALPTDVQSWTSTDGELWEHGADLNATWGLTLTGAGVAWDPDVARFRAVVGVQTSNSVLLLAGSSPDCITWDVFREIGLLPWKAEAASYVLPGVDAKHEVYFTLPVSGGRGLWRLPSNDGEQFILEPQAVALFDEQLGVRAPVAVSRFGPRDLVAVHPISSSAGGRRLGLIVSMRDDLSSWQSTNPSPLLEPSGQGGFDESSVVAGALAARGDRALLLYAARGQPLPSVDFADGVRLTTGSAWISATGRAPPDSEGARQADVCGDGTCQPSENCELCAVDCEPCDGLLSFADTFQSLDAWQPVAPTTEGAPPPFYRVPAVDRLNLDPTQPGWLAHTLENAVADFELSFDIHVVAPSKDVVEACTAYVGVGHMPALDDMEPQGAFVRIDQNLSCNPGAPSFCPHVRTGAAKVTTSLTVETAACSGTAFGVIEAWHHVALRRENGAVSVRLWGRDGCELASHAAQVGYLGALTELDTILVGWAAKFGDEGWKAPCEQGTGAISLDNLVLRSLPCPEGTGTCEGPGGQTTCVDLMNNPEHCGACFSPVGPGEICQAGQPSCQGNLCKDTDTGVETCVDLLESVKHCGACGVSLTEHEVCRDGRRQAKMVAMPPGFSIDSTEVTRAQYAAWLETSPTLEGLHPGCEGWKVQFTPRCGWPPGDRGNFPVRCVDWCDAFAYCQAVGKHLCGRIGGSVESSTERDTPDYDQWFHACTSGGRYDYVYGNDFDPEACSPGLDAEVASMSACQSPEAGYSGVWDLCGSASEWTACEGDGPEDRCRQRLAPGDDAVEGYCTSARVVPRNMGEPVTGFRCCAR